MSLTKRPRSFEEHVNDLLVQVANTRYGYTFERGCNVVLKMEDLGNGTMLATCSDCGMIAVVSDNPAVV